MIYIDFLKSEFCKKSIYEIKYSGVKMYVKSLVEKYGQEIGSIVGQGMDRTEKQISIDIENKLISFFNQKKDEWKIQELQLTTKRELIKEEALKLLGEN